MQRGTRDQIGYLFDSRMEPVLRVQSGETFVVETEDSRTGRCRTPEQCTPEALRQLKAHRYYSNPVTGPIYVEGSEPGDTLLVHVEHIEPDTQGYTGYDTTGTHFPEWFTEPCTYIYQIRDGYVHFGDRIRIPLRPMLGTIGTAPDLESPRSATVGKHGGNLDCPEVSSGNVVSLPVEVPGALLFLGDAHAVQGDGELSGGAIEMRSTTTLRVVLRKGRPASMTWPRIETPDTILVVAADKPLEAALKHAIRDMVLWLEAEYRFGRSEAYMLLGQVGSARACQAAGNLATPYTMSVAIPKQFLA
ncbi:MAG: acetamidase/formamidase family protein [Thermomicrobiales bacterium]